jgi:hypothetical protein
MAKRMLIFALNAAQAHRYINSTGRPLHSFIIVTGPELIMGIEPAQFDHILLTGWRENQMTVEAYDAWRVRIRTRGTATQRANTA